MALKDFTTQLKLGTTRQSRLLLIVGIGLITLLLYWAGLSGVFVLDDTPNLNVINLLPANPQWQDLWFAASTGTAGVLGRPLALLSFLLQYQAWPDPFQFKLVNLLLHLVNGALLAWFCVLLRRQSTWQVSNAVIALVVFVWLVHPLQASTVFYVVQRMTELSTLFTIAGINLYLIGRQSLLQGRINAGYGYAALGLFGCGLLAVLSKENGVLLFPYVLVLEVTMLADASTNRALIQARRYLVFLPTLIGVLGFLLYLPGALQGYELKSFTFMERVTSQFAAILSYLLNAALLFPNDFGIFHDDFPLARSLLNPWYTLPAIVIVISVLAIVVVKRRQWPLLAFAVLWYLAGHALESTVLPLELYFEHRNYLPLFGPVLAAFYKLHSVWPMLTPDRRQLLVGAVTLLVVWMCVLMWQQSRLWGNPQMFAVNAVAQHPNSARAQSNLVETLTRYGEVEAAFEYHLSTIDAQQFRIAQYIRWLEFSCLLPDIALPDRTTLATQARQSGHDFSAISLLNNLTFGIIQNRCAQAPAAETDLVMVNLLENPAFAVSRADLLQMRGFLAAGSGDFARAADLAAASFAVREDVRVALYRTTWLLRAGQRDRAVEEFRLLTVAFESEIATSADLTARYEFLQQELNVNP